MKSVACRWALRIAAGVLLFTAIVYARVIYESQKYYFLAGEALKNPRTGDALLLLRKSAMWYAPFNPHVKNAHERLWQIGRKAELAGDQDLALEAYRAIRSSILAARSFYTPEVSTLDRVNERISVLMSRKSHPPAFKGKSEEELHRLHYGLLSDIPQPDPKWSIVLIAGFFIWTGSIVYFIFSGLSSSLKIIRTPFLSSLLVFFVGMVLWITGMLMA